MDTSVQNANLLSCLWLKTGSGGFIDSFLSFCNYFLFWPLSLNIFFFSQKLPSIMDISLSFFSFSCMPVCYRVSSFLDSLPLCMLYHRDMEIVMDKEIRKIKPLFIFFHFLSVWPAHRYVAPSAAVFSFPAHRVSFGAFV